MSGRVSAQLREALAWLTNRVPWSDEDAATAYEKGHAALAALDSGALVVLDAETVDAIEATLTAAHELLDLHGSVTVAKQVAEALAKLREARSGA